MRRHLLTLRALERPQIEALLDAAQVYADDGDRGHPTLAGRPVATLFYEPSTRTEMSFELAAARLGAVVLRCDVDHSSVLVQRRRKEGWRREANMPTHCICPILPFQA